MPSPLRGALSRALAKLRGAPLPQALPGWGYSGLVFQPSPFDPRPIKTKAQFTDANLGWVYAAVSLISGDLRSNAWEILDRNGEAVDRKQSDAVRILEKPWPGMLWGDLIELTSANLDLTGEAFWWIVDSGTGNGSVTGIQHVPAWWVGAPLLNRAVPSWQLNIPGNQTIEVPMTDLVWFRIPHPGDPWRAMSPVEAFALSYNLDIYSRAYGAALMKNWAQPPGLISSQSDEISDEEAAVIADRWRESRKDPSTVAVFGKGAQYQPIAVSVKDLAFIDLARMTREQILGIYRVPPGKLGLAEEGGTAAEHEARDNSYAKNCLKPRLDRIAETINAAVIPRLVGRADALLDAFTFEFENPVRKDEQFALVKAEQGLHSGVIRVNEYREETGREPLDGPEGELFILPFGARLVEKLEPTPETDWSSFRFGGEGAPRPGDEKDNAADDEDQDEEDGARRAKKRGWLPDNFQPRLTRFDKARSEGRYIVASDRLEIKTAADIRVLFEKESELVIAALPDILKSLRMEVSRGADGWPALTFAQETRDVIDDKLKLIAEQWLKTMRTAYKRGMETGWQLLTDDVARTLLDFGLFERQARTIAERESSELVRRVSDTTKENLRQLIANAIDNGDDILSGASYDKLSRQIREMYSDFKKYRADAIARTEVAWSINKGRYEHSERAQNKLKIKIYNYWLSILDDSTRDGHYAANDQRQRLGQYFHVRNDRTGEFEELLYPGDRENGAAPENTINCRCTLISEAFEADEED